MASLCLRRKFHTFIILSLFADRRRRYQRHVSFRFIRIPPKERRQICVKRLSYQEKPKGPKDSLIDRLRDRLRRKGANSIDTGTDEDEPHSTVRKISKLNAKKSVHRVHLGWHLFDEKKTSYFQVRAKTG